MNIDERFNGLENLMVAMSHQLDEIREHVLRLGKPPSQSQSSGERNYIGMGVDDSQNV